LSGPRGLQFGDDRGVIAKRLHVIPQSLHAVKLEPMLRALRQPPGKGRPLLFARLI